MKLNAYCIFDEKAAAYHNPFFFSHDGMATRAFCDEAENENSMIGKHKSDYKLYRVGTFNPESAELVKVNEPVFLMSGSQLQKELPLGSEE